MSDLSAQLLARLAAERAALLSVAATVPADQLWPPDGSWGVGDALVHIEPMEHWLLEPVEREVPELRAMDSARRDVLVAPDRGKPLAEIISRLARRREATIAAIAACPSLEVSVATQWGPLTRAQLVRMVYRHDAEHRAQIEELLA